MNPEEKDQTKSSNLPSKTDPNEKSTPEEMKRTEEESVEQISEHIMKIHDEIFKKLAATKWVKK